MLTLNLHSTDVLHLDKLELISSLTKDESLLCLPKGSTLAEKESEQDIWDAFLRIRHVEDRYFLHEMFLGQSTKRLYEWTNIEDLLKQTLFEVAIRIARNVKHKDKFTNIPLEFDWVKVDWHGVW